MKYWKNTEIEHMTCEEGQRIIPYKYPASKVTKTLSTGEKTFVEIEIIPNTLEIRDYVDYRIFDSTYGLCTMVEHRQHRADGRYYEEQFFVPLGLLGYTKAPCSSKSFDDAMKTVEGDS